jgi:hypothetical protein
MKTMQTLEESVPLVEDAIKDYTTQEKVSTIVSVLGYLIYKNDLNRDLIFYGIDAAIELYENKDMI